MNPEKAIKLVGIAEGKWTNDPRDSGGITACGLARNKNPDLDIWKTIDKYLNRGLSLAQIEKICRDDKSFMRQVYSIYVGRYWNTAHCDDMPKKLKYPVFSCSVNCGHMWAIKLLQRAAGIKSDGIFGRNTWLACKYQNTNELCDKFYDCWIAYYKAIVKNNPKQQVFLKGWLNRIEQVKKDNCD